MSGPEQQLVLADCAMPSFEFYALNVTRVESLCITLVAALSCGWVE